MKTTLRGTIADWPHSGETINGYIWAVPDRFSNGIAIDVSNGVVKETMLKSGQWSFEFCFGVNTDSFQVVLDEGMVNVEDIMPGATNNPLMRGPKGDKGDPGKDGDDVVKQAVSELNQRFTTQTIGVGSQPNSNILAYLSTTNGDSRVGLRVEQRNTAANVDAVKIVNNAPAYALKIDHTADNQDAVNISHMGSGAYTTLGLGGSNTTLSTIKVTNDAPQVGGSVVFAQGTHKDRTAAIFGGDSCGSAGSIFSARAVNDSNATAFRAIYDSGYQHDARVFWVDANHASGQLFYLNNGTPQMSGQMVRIINSSGSTAPIIVINNNGSGNHIEADNFRVSKTGQISAGSILNFAAFNNGRVQLPNAGPLIDRNVADSSAALRVNQMHADSTGDIAQFQAGGSVKARISKTGAVSTLSNVAPSDSSIAVGEASIWFDSVNGVLGIKAKDVNGTIKTGSISLT